jgi:hypothetical protein
LSFRSGSALISQQRSGSFWDVFEVHSLKHRQITNGIQPLNGRADQRIANQRINASSSAP